MNTPEPDNSNPRSFMRNHQFSFRVKDRSKSPDELRIGPIRNGSLKQHDRSKSSEELRNPRLAFIRNGSLRQCRSKSPDELRHGRLGFIRNNSLRRLLEGKHNEDQTGFQMHKHHKLMIRSYLGSKEEDETFPEEPESKEDESSSTFDRLYLEKEDFKPRYGFEESEEEHIVHDNHHPQRSLIHTIDEMPIPMKMSKRNLFDEDDKGKQQKELENTSPRSHFSMERKMIHTIDEMPIPMKQSKRNLFDYDADEKYKLGYEPLESGNKSDPHLVNDDEKEKLGYESLESDSMSNPDHRLQRRLPPPGLMKRRNSVTKFSRCILQEQLDTAKQSKRNLFDDDADEKEKLGYESLEYGNSSDPHLDDEKEKLGYESLEYGFMPEPNPERRMPPPGLMKRRNSVTKFSRSMLEEQLDAAKA